MMQFAFGPCLARSRTVVSAVDRLGIRPGVEVGMERIRIEKRTVKPRPRPKILPLDPRDPDILHAKAIQERYVPPRRRAA